ncbi:MAG: hypothetical protein WCA81_18540 [Rhizomicrobium sp.]
MTSNMRKQGIGTAVRRALLVVLPLLTAACAGSSTSQLVKSPDYTDHSVKSLVVVQADDSLAGENRQLADDLAAAMVKRGYSARNASEASILLTKYDLARANLFAPSALSALEKEGVDAVVSVDSRSASMGGPSMRHIVVSATSTHTQKQIGTFHWNNAWGGMPGSPADFMMRDSRTEAVEKIAESLAQLLG